MIPAFRAAVANLSPYYQAPLAGNPHRLDQNTNLYGANPAIARVQANALALENYPTRDADPLCEALADYVGVAANQICVGNGSDEILDILVKTCVEFGGSIASPWPSYALYPYYAKLMGNSFTTFPLTGSLEIDVARCKKIRADLLLLASPNNPTSRQLSLAALREIALVRKGWVVVDEAYFEYGHEQSAISLLDEFPQIIVLRTLSKAFGLAGLRVGYAIAAPEVAEKLRLVKPPFNVNLVSEAIAIEALSDLSWMQNVVAQTREDRGWLCENLEAAGWKIVPSDANFVLARIPANCTLTPTEIRDQLCEKGFLVRIFPAAPGLADYVRFTVAPLRIADPMLVALRELIT